LLKESNYHEMEGMRDDEFLKQHCPLITTIKHDKDLFRCLERRELFPAFLVHGSMELIKEVIVGFNDCESGYHIYDEDISKAVALCFKEDRHECAFGLLEAIQARHAVADQQEEQAGKEANFDWFMNDLFLSYHPLVQSSMPIKRFLALHGGMNLVKRIQKSLKLFVNTW